MSKRAEKRVAVTAVRAAAPETPSETTSWVKPAGLSRRGLLVLLGLIILVNVPVLHRLLRGPMPTTVSVPFSDDFSGSQLDARYFSTGGDWRTREGILISPSVHNNALWLKAQLPDNVRITVDARTIVPEGDIRLELFGDGENALSGYRLVLAPSGTGTRATLYRRSESGPLWSDVRSRTGFYQRSSPLRVEGATLPLKTSEPQRWVVERRQHSLRWTVNGQLALEFTDPFPLGGAGNDRLGLSGSELDVFYDGLTVENASADPFPLLAGSPPPLLRPPTGAIADDFERAEVGPNWKPTDPGSVRIEEGALVIERAHNHPVWLARSLPANAVIELDAWSDSPDGDLKVEAWGDGSSAHQGDLGAAYKASGYVLVMGGWRNTRSVIARREEHGSDMAERTDRKVEAGRHYHWRITRRGSVLSWEIDGAPFLELQDPAPLSGPGQDAFALSDWETRVHFDNVRITPLP